MDRPSSPQLDAIIRAASNLRAMETLVSEAKTRLVAEVESLATVADKSERLAAAIYAYWHVPETNANQLAKITVGKESSALMLKHADAVSIGVSCDRCKADLEITSRAMMQKVQAASTGSFKRWAEGWKVICADCQVDVFDVRRNEHEQRDMAVKKRRLVLATLSYEEYLRTPEWHEQRNRALDMVLYLQGELSCEVCRERDKLSLVHRQLDLASGTEEVSLLCATCSGALEQVGKLARTPITANQEARLDLDPIEKSFRIDRGWESV